MKNIILGLRKEYLIRQYFFGLGMAAVAVWFVLTFNKNSEHLLLIFGFFVLNTLLYPYARYAYEMILEWILGRNVFLFEAWFFVLGKAILMFLCWWFAIFLAPVGFFLIWMHQKKA